MIMILRKGGMNYPVSVVVHPEDSQNIHRSEDSGGNCIVSILEFLIILYNSHSLKQTVIYTTHRLM